MKAKSQATEPQNATPHGLIDEDEATRFLGGVSPKHIYNLRRDHGLPFVKVGGRIMYRAASLEAWAASREQVAK